MLQHVFVYGTLKRGECRERCWPVEPNAVCEAWTFGELYNIGPFPAMVAGRDRVLGELWSFETLALPSVLAALDVIEGTNQPGRVNEYDRVIVDVLVDSEHEQPVRAYTYLYAEKHLLKSFKRLLPSIRFGKQWCAIWPPRPPHESV